MWTITDLKSFSVLMVCLSFFSQTVAAEPSGSDGFRESVSIETDTAISKRIIDAEDYIAERKWPQAIAILQRILADGGRALVPLHSGLYVNAQRRCNLLLSHFPQAGRAVYRQTIDAQAKAWFDAAEKGESIPLMNRVIQRAYASSYGDDALLRLGQWAWNRGEVTTAKKHWSQLLPANSRATLHYPGTDLDVAAIRARCILCDLVDGDLQRARDALRELKRRTPDARGTIAGKTGSLVEIIDDILRVGRGWSFDNTSVDSPTFAANARRNGQLSAPVDVGPMLWSRKLDRQQLPKPADTTGLNRAPHAACFPACVDGVVYVCLADRVFAYALKSGRPAFPSAADAKTPVEQRAVVYPEVPSGLTPLPNRPSLGVARFSVTIHDGRLFARLGSPVSGRSSSEVRATRSAIICYSLREDRSRLEWKLSSQTLGRGWEFEGSPLVADGRLYVAMRLRNPETQAYVGCFDSRTGKPIWTQRVCTALATVGDRQNQVSQNLLTLGDESVFYSTDLGAIAAIDRTDGHIAWLATYPTRRPDRPADWNNAMKRGFTPCLLTPDVLVAAPVDSNELLGIDPGTGSIIWRRELRGGVRHLLGGDSQRLIVSGNRLWGLEIRTGRVLWNRGFEDPAGYGFGRGVSADEFVYWPLRDEILVIRKDNGEIVRRIRLRALHGARGGNLLVAEGRLVVAEARRLVVYGIHAARTPRK